MEKKGDLRRQERTRLSGPIQLSWTDPKGEQKFATGQMVDISESGMRIRTREPFAKYVYVGLHAEQIGLHGTASVRSCARQEPNYIVGLEFSGGLKWKQKSEEK